jgi:UDP-N-acetyl-D-mannosaminuronic acid dehydrogenase
MDLAFKPNIDDLRESPAKYITQQVLKNSNSSDDFIVEPNIESYSFFKLIESEYAVKSRCYCFFCCPQAV